MTPPGNRTTVLRLGVAAEDTPRVVAGLGLRPYRANVRRLSVLETTGSLDPWDHARPPHPLLDAGVTAQAEVGATGAVVTLRHRSVDSAGAPAARVTWLLRHEWAPHMRAPRPVHVATAVLPTGPVADGMRRLWGDPYGRWLVLGAVAERSWRVAVRDLDLTVLRWTLEGVRSPPLLQIEHSVAPPDAPFVLPVLRAVGVRLGVDPALTIEPLDVRALRGLAGSPFR